jgi:hypothetical protein
VRRRPAAATAAAAVAVVALTVVGGSLWVLADRAAVAREVEKDLDRVAEAHGRAAWAEANAGLIRAAARLGDRGPDPAPRPP